MKNWLKILLVLIVIGILTALYVYIFVYNKPHPNYEKEKPDFTLKAHDIYYEFKADKTAARQKYTGKVIQINGQLNMIDENQSLKTIVFVFNKGDFGDEGIRCSLLPKFNDDAKMLKPGDDVNIKGYCTGFNDSDVIFEKCSIIK